MKILIVGRYKKEFYGNLLPFVIEQGESLCTAGCEVDYFPVTGNYLLAVKALKQKIKEFKPDIIHAHYGLSAVTAELQYLCPVVTTFHNGEWHTWWVNFISSLMAKRAKHLIYVAPHIREKMYFKHKHYSILPCGVNIAECKPIEYNDARRTLGFASNKKYILFGGTFDNKRKNVELLRSAVALLPNRDNIEIIEMRGMNRQTVTLYMSACDLFALPTKNEGSPQALKEAMACNCPIVATDVADIAYLLGNLDGHYIISNKNSNKAEWVGDETSVNEFKLFLAEALNLSAGFRTAGRDRIVQLGYTNELVAQRLIEIYNQVLNG